MPSIMRRRSGLMGVVVFIGVLVLRWRLLDPSTLKTGHFHPVTALPCSRHSSDIPTDVPRLPQAGAKRLRSLTHRRLNCAPLVSSFDRYVNNPDFRSS
jgi:hypothetical protein